MSSLESKVDGESPSINRGVSFSVTEEKRSSNILYW